MGSPIIMYPFLFAALYFEVFLLLSFLKGKRTRSTVPAFPEILPSVTIFIPCYNEERTVVKTLDSLCALEYPKDKLSIFAINDGSKDNTLPVLREYSAAHPQVTVLDKPNGGKHTALNLGLTHATSDLVGCLDADSYVASNALMESIRYFASADVMAVTPAIKVAVAGTFIQRIQHAEYGLSAFIRRTFSWMDAIFITPGPFSIFRREVFTILGPYKAAHNTEDMEIALRMQSHGMRIENAPNSHVFTNAPRNYPALFRQRVRWSYGFLKNAQDYRFMFFNPKYGTLGMFLLPMGIFTIIPGLYFTGLSVAYGAENAAKAADRARVIGIHFPTAIHFPIIDWFYFNTSAFAILSLVLGLITVSIIVIGKKLAGDKGFFDIALYLLTYGLLAPWWLIRAVYNVATHKEQSWAREIDVRRQTDG
jgi:cellulose synthase/poly-beta-1,6-N-acetylglucosamine synthase-like glycosyltransferase